MSKHQTKLIKQYEKEGWFVLNLIRTNKPGIPDLLCLKDGEKPLFVESKEINDTVKPLQEYRIRELIALGFDARVDKATK